MRIFHISDLHIGKQLNYYSLWENQKKVLDEIVTKMTLYRPDVLLIAGDIFDKSMPSGEAYTLFDDFLNQIGAIQPVIPVCIIAGNHDSPERLNYASSFMERHQIYISVMPPANEEEFLKKIVLTDEWGPVNIYLLPFTKPGYVRHLFPEETIKDYESGVRAVLEREAIDFGQRNILVSHQFYQTGGWETATCDSEQVSLTVGGLDRIDISAIKDFDYAALGHLHGPQKIRYDHLRYSGSPLKYSVSEAHQKKGILMIDLKAKGEPMEIQKLPLTGCLDVRAERGTVAEVLSRATEENCHDFLQVTVTDEAEPYRMKEQLREIYDHLLEIRVDNQRTRSKFKESCLNYEQVTPGQAFGLFYEAVYHEPMGEEEEALIQEILGEVGEED